MVSRSGKYRVSRSEQTAPEGCFDLVQVLFTATVIYFFLITDVNHFYDEQFQFVTIQYEIWAICKENLTTGNQIMQDIIM